MACLSLHLILGCWMLDVGNLFFRRNLGFLGLNIAPLRGAMPVRAAPVFSKLASARAAFNFQCSTFKLENGRCCDISLVRRAVKCAKSFSGIQHSFLDNSRTSSGSLTLRSATNSLTIVKKIVAWERCLPRGLAESASIYGTAKLFEFQLSIGAAFVLLDYTPSQQTPCLNTRTLP